MVYVWTKFHENILNGFSYGADMKSQQTDEWQPRHNTSHLRRAYKNFYDNWLEIFTEELQLQDFQNKIASTKMC